MVQPFNFYLFTQEEWKHIYFYRMTCARMFIAALLIIVPTAQMSINMCMDKNIEVYLSDGIIFSN